MTELSTRSVPVLVVLGSQAALIDSALAVQEGRPARIDIREVRLPEGLTIDPSFPAVPLGPQQSPERPEDARPESFLPQNSETFVVRAFVHADDPGKGPEQIGAARLYSDPTVEPFITCRGDPAVGSVTDVQNNLDTSKLATYGLDGSDVAVAIVDMGINLPFLSNKLGTTPSLDVANSWTRPGIPTPPGQHPKAHGTMCAFDALIAAPNATLLDYCALIKGAEALSTTLSTVLQAYGQLLIDCLLARLPPIAVRGFVRKGLGKYKALVVSNSWGVRNQNQDFPPGNPGRYVDNPNHPFQRIVSVLALFGADILFAGGDCGADCPNPQCGGTMGSIMGANASASVLSLAGCDIHDNRVGYSSQGPSIAKMPQDKPDVTAYTHFLGSEIDPGKPDSGISAACPVAAGCVAALRTKIRPLQVSPAFLFRILQISTRQVGGPPGWNQDYGFGIINPVFAGQKLGLIPP